MSGSPARLQSWLPTTGQLAGLDGTNFVSRLTAQGGVMRTLAQDSTQTGVNDRAAILQYLLDVRDARVTGSLDLGTATIGSPAGPSNVGNVVIANERSLPITYDAPTFSASDGFSVTSESCPLRSVGSGLACTITLQFQPATPPAGSRAANLNLTLRGTDNTNPPVPPVDNDPPPRSVGLSGTAQLPVSSNASLLSLTSQAGLPATASLVLTNRRSEGCYVDGRCHHSRAQRRASAFDRPRLPILPPLSAASLATPCRAAPPVPYRYEFTPTALNQRDATLTLTYRLADGVTLIDVPVTLRGLSALQGRLGSTTFSVTFASTEINASREQSLAIEQHRHFAADTDCSDTDRPGSRRLRADWNMR